LNDGVVGEAEDGDGGASKGVDYPAAIVKVDVDVVGADDDGWDALGAVVSVCLS